ncbi:MAG: endonuclease/exonuclease/phosphatase family protein [Gammaproteobacteria bacterium]|jgi:endonuclease/exonuclease/phosphatase family metal-dependent hydrolase|nr:endonuclease [Chromatiales bacterium]MCP4927372.1 endonuclease [Gammaproteobacteria bacterium]MDP7419027.1 endonuclease/exonuclease/phosphatase family protein [Gammaproteobacteria bacterium]MDP7660117.1 endonuclease/exonuclease/phosphatase family protein [Gammaproteobacteria bacterium]HJP39862.1 endonuclease/exonuclease/phosphatase family protein [Gammaproteobacteria bacterium]
MRLLVYNIRYAVGAGPTPRIPVPGAGYLFGNPGNLTSITSFIKSIDPDIVGLIEVDIGSMRSGRTNQADAIADSLGHFSAYACKYGEESVNQLIPILRKQGNAFLAAPRITGERFHYFDQGIKKLIIELELDDVAIFLVHLSLKYRHRHFQLRHLYELVKKSNKPVIVAGDFNTFWGKNEIFLFLQAAGLKSANVLSAPTYPSRSPRMELDFILYGEGIEVTNFEIVDVGFSDHLPLICDFEIVRTE